MSTSIMIKNNNNIFKDKTAKNCFYTNKKKKKKITQV